MSPTFGILSLPLTAGSLQAIRKRTLSIPDQVALVGFDETIWATLMQPAITVLAQPTDEIGKTATELLLQRIVDRNRAPRTVILKGQLLVRGSSAPRGQKFSQIDANMTPDLFEQLELPSGSTVSRGRRRTA